MKTNRDAATALGLALARHAKELAAPAYDRQRYCIQG
jgi:hypothetical protein